MIAACIAVGLQAADVPKEEPKPFHLTTTLGETYKNCRIIKVTPEAITVVHDGGVAKVGFVILDDEWKKKFAYDPGKARAFAEAEQERAGEAAVKRAEQNRKRELREEEMLAELAAQERKRIEAEARLAKEQADAARAASMPQTPLAALPGDPAPAPVAQTPAPIMQTEVVVPMVTPITDVYTPTKIRSQNFILPEGYYYGGYAPYGFSPYGYYQPIYTYPGTGYPIHGHPGGICPPHVLRPGVSGTISSGGMSIQITR